MKVRDVMTTQLVTVTPDTPYKAIVERSVLGDVSGVPVVDSSGQLVGIVTEADLVSKEAYGGRRRRRSRCWPTCCRRESTTGSPRRRVGPRPT